MCGSEKGEGRATLRRYAAVFKFRSISDFVYSAPEITTRHLVLSARPDIPSTVMEDGEDVDMSWTTEQNPPRPAYPEEVLKHRFMPYGSLAPPRDGVVSVDMDSVPEIVQNQISATHTEKPAKGKKRKTEDGEKKKSKKAKKAE